jgi:hypothetical protein
MTRGSETANPLESRSPLMLSPQAAPRPHDAMGSLGRHPVRLVMQPRRFLAAWRRRRRENQRREARQIGEEPLAAGSNLFREIGVRCNGIDIGANGIPKPRPGR